MIIVLYFLRDAYHQALRDLRRDAPSCFQREKSSVHIATLSDSVERWTSAVSSDAKSKRQHPDCIDTSVIESTFDSITQVVHQAIAKLQGVKAVNYFRINEAGALTVWKLSKAPHLDHVHVYKNVNRGQGRYLCA